MSNLILLDKPSGMTSFKAIAILKRKLSIKRIGHTGTLDPMATGVLPILCGQATRLSSLLTESDKRYTASILLGKTTDTEDITGKVLSESPVAVSEEKIRDCILKFKGTYSQLPPMYSALKKDGVRLYELARKGIDIEREKREVTIKEINVLDITLPDRLTIDVLCSKGTYIRTLCKDIGEALGCGAVLTDLRRTYSAGFDISQCVTLDQILEDEDNSFLLPAEDAVKGFSEVDVTDKQAVRFLNGGELDLERLKIDNPNDKELFRVKTKGWFIGMGEVSHEKRMLTIKCIIND